MQEFTSQGARIAFLDARPAEPESGRPVLLVHGFASNHAVNWVFPHWVKTLNAAGRRAILIDNRGHGRSDKLYRPEDYDLSLMADDARNLLNHLDLDVVDVMGYSLGARIAAVFALTYRDRARAFVFGGLGSKIFETAGLGEPIAAALEAPSAAALDAGLGKTFRTFAESTKSDLRALAACARGARRKFGAAELGSIRASVLVAVGTKDDIAGDPQPLAALLPAGQALAVPQRDHNRTVGDVVFKRAALDFLTSWT
jgi:pimeloyl-ACP methyl ester carboxylesterase